MNSTVLLILYGIHHLFSKVHWARQQLISDHSKYHLSERSEWEHFDDEQEQLDMNTFLKSINSSDSVTTCNVGPFGCVEFPSHLLDYLVSISFVLHNQNRLIV